MSESHHGSAKTDLCELLVQTNALSYPENSEKNNENICSYLALERTIRGPMNEHTRGEV